MTGRDLARAMERRVIGGGRLVIGLLPVESAWSPDRAARKKKESAGDKGKKGKVAPEKKKKGAAPQDMREKLLKTVLGDASLLKRWRFDYEVFKNPRKKGAALWAVNRSGLPLAPRISWHGALYFTGLDRAWRVIYAVGDKPVMIERKYGRGSIVLSADSFAFSNESLHQEPHPELLTWFVGSSREVMFDEQHLGLSESRGIAGLARKYRLEGLLLGLLVFAVLFVWKNATSLVPPLDDGSEGDGGLMASQRDYNAGLVSLLRRNIREKNLIPVCYQAWRDSLPREEREAEGQAGRVRAVVESGDGASGSGSDPVAAYRRIYEILSEGKKKWSGTRTF